MVFGRRVLEKLLWDDAPGKKLERVSRKTILLRNSGGMIVLEKKLEGDSRKTAC